MSIRDRIKMINESVDDEVDFDRFAHPVDSDEDENLPVPTEDEVSDEEESKETADDVINRAVTEETTAINTYDEILGLIEDNEDLKGMIEEIKADEEEHLQLLTHYVETGEVLSDEDLEKQEDEKDSDDEDEEKEEVDECDEQTTEKEDLKESDATPEFLEELKNLLNTYCRQSINSITLEKDEKLGEDIVNVDGKKINIEGDSNLAVIKDILHQIG